MIWIYLLALFMLTLLGAFIPIFFKKFDQSWMTLLLAFSGAFLLSITLIHLLPEVFHELGEKAGVYILIGFGVQLLLQRLSHGVEHGHTHVHEGASLNIFPIFIGLFIHAFMEGIPMGFVYQSPAAAPSIFLAIAAHKIPEAVTLSTILIASHFANKKWKYILLFALASPLAGMLAMYFGEKFDFISTQLIFIIPIVAGAFLHISTTILYESGTKHHQLSKQKSIAIMLGILLSLATLLFHVHE